MQFARLFEAALKPKETQRNLRPHGIAENEVSISMHVHGSFIGQKGRPHHKNTCPRQVWANAAQGAFDLLPMTDEPLTSLSPLCSTILLAVPKPKEGEILKPILQSISAAKYENGRWLPCEVKSP